MRFLLLAVLACGSPSRDPITPPPVPPRVDPPPMPAPVAPASTLALGGKHTCLLERGIVWCWGDNDRGQLGDGTREEPPRPVRVVGLENPIAISLGNEHSCAIERGGRVVCWGRGAEGELLAGTGVQRGSNPKELPDSTRPLAIAGVTAVELAAGYNHTCARLATGSIACWGNASHGELGGADSSPQQLVPGIDDAIAIRTGTTTSCAIRKTGVVTCWGGHWLGGLFASERKAQPPTEIAPLAGVSELAIGATHACGIRGGEVICHGESNLLGDPAVACCKPATTRLPLADARGVAAGFRHTCARRAGTVECWTSDRTGTPTAPAAIAGLADVTQLASNWFHTCVLRTTGEVACWGDDQHGQLGRGISGRITRPTRVVQLDDASELAIGYIHSCARRSDGRVACWVDSRGAVDIPQLGVAVAVSSGIYETCARSAAGAVACVQRSQTRFPAGKLVIPAGADGLQVAGAGICVRTKSGGLACVEEIPDAHRMPDQLPARTLTAIAGFAGVKLFGAGDHQICAATAKDVVCAKHTDGRMRAAKASPWSKPVVVKGLAGADVVAIAGGGNHACALLRTGGIACWGSGSRGQLGDGKLANSDEPVLVKGIADAVGLAVGQEHACAHRKDGSLWCWGDDDNGQLGDGDRAFTPRNEPAKVGGLDAVLEVDAGADHTCARTASGVYCWGSNQGGRLGIGVEPSSKTPVIVSR